MVAPDEIIIREYREGDEVQINLLHNKEYGTSRGVESWQWEFMNGPYGKSIFVVAENKGEIIGTQALLPITLCYRERQIRSAKSEETLLKVEFRGKGVFNKLYDKCFELAAKRGISLIWGFTNAEGPFRNCGFEIPGRLKHFILILKPALANKIREGRVPEQFKKSIRSQVAQKLLLRIFTSMGFIWYKARYSRFNLSPILTSVAITGVDERFNVFWDAFRQKGSFYTINRTSIYLNWRILTNPNMTYRLLTVLKNNNIQGYIILGNNNRENVGYITDLCVLDEHFEEVAGFLISHAIDYFRGQGIAYIDAWYVGNNPETKKYSSCLRKFGFLSVPMGGCVVMKILDSEESFPVDPNELNQWFINDLFSEGAG